MQIEVDQSGKIENTKTATVLAFSNNIDYSILIPATVKRDCIEYLRKHYQRLHQPYMKFFAAALFLLLNKHLTKLDAVIIDEEYVGHAGTIKGMLLNYIRRIQIDFPKEKILFRRIGRKSKAHQKAYSTFVGNIKPDYKVTTDELLRLFRK